MEKAKMDPTVLEQAILSSVVNAVIFVNKVHVFGCICVTVDGSESQSVTLKLNKLMGQVDKPLSRDKHIEESLIKLRSKFRKRSSSFDGRYMTTDENENVETELSAFRRSHSADRSSASPSETLPDEKKVPLDRCQNSVKPVADAGERLSNCGAESKVTVTTGNLEGGVVDPKHRLVLEKALKEFLKMKYQQKLSAKTQSPNNDTSVVPNTSPIPPEFLKLVSLQARIMGVSLSSEYPLGNTKAAAAGLEKPKGTALDSMANGGNCPTLFRDISAKTPHGISELVLKKNPNNINTTKAITSEVASPRSVSDASTLSQGLGITKQKRLSFTGSSDKYQEQQGAFTEAMHKKLDIINSTSQQPDLEPSLLKRKSLFRTGSSDKRKEFVKQMLEKCSSKSDTGLNRRNDHIPKNSVSNIGAFKPLTPASATEVNLRWDGNASELPGDVVKPGVNDVQKSQNSLKPKGSVKLDIFKEFLSDPQTTDAFNASDPSNVYTFKPIEISPTDNLVDSCTLRNSETFPSQEPCANSEESTDDAIQKASEESTQKAAVVLTKTLTVDLTQKSTEESTVKSVEGSTEKRTEESTQKPAEEFTSEAAKEFTPKPVEKSVQKPRNESIPKQTKASAQKDCQREMQKLFDVAPKVESIKLACDKKGVSEKFENREITSGYGEKRATVTAEAHPFLSQNSLDCLVKDDPDIEHDVVHYAENFILPFSDIDGIPDMPAEAPRSKCELPFECASVVNECVMDGLSDLGERNKGVMGVNEDSNSSLLSIGSVGFEMNSVETPRKHTFSTAISAVKLEPKTEVESKNPPTNQVNSADGSTNVITGRNRQRKSKPKKYSPRKQDRKCRANGLKRLKSASAAERGSLRSGVVHGQNSSPKLSLKRSTVSSDFETDDARKRSKLAKNADQATNQISPALLSPVQDSKKICRKAKTGSVVCSNTKPAELLLNAGHRQLAIREDNCGVKNNSDILAISNSFGACTESRTHPAVTSQRLDSAESDDLRRLKITRNLPAVMKSAAIEAHTKRLKHDMKVLQKIRPISEPETLVDTLPKTSRSDKCQNTDTVSAKAAIDKKKNNDIFALRAAAFQNSQKINKQGDEEKDAVRKHAYRSLPVISSSTAGSMVSTKTNVTAEVDTDKISPQEPANGEMKPLQEGHFNEDSNGQTIPTDLLAPSQEVPILRDHTMSRVAKQQNAPFSCTQKSASSLFLCDPETKATVAVKCSVKPNVDNIAKKTSIGNAVSTPASIGNSTRQEYTFSKTAQSFTTSSYGHLLVRPVPTVYSNPILSKHKAYPKTGTAVVVNSICKSDTPSSSKSLSPLRLNPDKGIPTETQRSVCDNIVKPTSRVVTRTINSTTPTFSSLRKEDISEKSDSEGTNDCQSTLLRLAPVNIPLERQKDACKRTVNDNRSGCADKVFTNTAPDLKRVATDKTTSPALGRLQTSDKENDTFVKFVLSPVSNSPSRSGKRRSGSSKRKPRARKSSNQGATEMWLVPKQQQSLSP